MWKKEGNEDHYALEHYALYTKHEGKRAAKGDKSMSHESLHIVCTSFSYTKGAN